MHHPHPAPTAAVVSTTVFLVGGDDQTIMLELLVLLGILIISLLLQARAEFNTRLCMPAAAQRCQSDAMRCLVS